MDADDVSWPPSAAARRLTTCVGAGCPLGPPAGRRSSAVAFMPSCLVVNNQVVSRTFPLPQAEPIGQPVAQLVQPAPVASAVPQPGPQPSVTVSENLRNCTAASYTSASSAVAASNSAGTSP